MKMSQQLEDAFNAQITLELESSIAYLQMAAFLDGQNLSGMSGWMRAQSAEETAHAHRFFDFVLDRGNQVRIGATAAPLSEFTMAADAFTASLEQERRVTKSIHDLYRLAAEHGDLGCVPFLQEFIGEQNEEEATVETILERIKMAEGNSGALLLLDSELGARPATGV
jgi:ferritin